MSQRSIPCYKAIFSSLLLIFSAAILSGCSKKQTEPIQQSGFYFDTIISVTLYDSSKTKELAHCFELAGLYEQYFSTKIPESDISRINAAGGKAVEVHADTVELIRKGIFYSKLSNGKFDITIGKLANLWDFQAKTPAVPNREKIADAVSSIGYQDIAIKGNKVSLANPDTALDLGGIAKGYIADKMKAYLLSQGVTRGLINLGGNVLAIGEKEDGSAYAIGIQKPFDETGATIAGVKIKDRTVVTSGTYERYFKQGGRIYHHILDVETGYPYQNGLSGVTIICKNSVDGDGLSTACFALGLEKGMELIESLEDTEAIFITDGNELHYSSGMGTDVPLL